MLDSSLAVLSSFAVTTEHVDTNFIVSEKQRVVPIIITSYISSHLSPCPRSELA